jgi:hypothetical protein
MADIATFVEDRGVFEPEALDAMAQAYEEACIALHVFAGDQRGREAVAARIIELARRGLIDVATVRNRVIMGARSAA